MWPRARATRETGWEGIVAQPRVPSISQIINRFPWQRDVAYSRLAGAPPHRLWAARASTRTHTPSKIRGRARRHASRALAYSIRRLRRSAFMNTRISLDSSIQHRWGGQPREPSVHTPSLSNNNSYSLSLYSIDAIIFIFKRHSFAQTLPILQNKRCRILKMIITS